MFNRSLIYHTCELEKTNINYIQPSDIDVFGTESYIETTNTHLSGHIERSNHILKHIDNFIEEIESNMSKKQFSEEKFKLLKTKKNTLKCNDLLSGLQESFKLVNITKSILNMPISKSEEDLKKLIDKIKNINLKMFTSVEKDHGRYYIIVPNDKINKVSSGKDVTYTSLGYSKLFISKITDGNYKNILTSLINLKSDFENVTKKYESSDKSKYARAHHFAVYELYRCNLERSWYYYFDNALAIAKTIVKGSYI
jgi:hypothetical protein